jgi:hypothetical protein
MSARGAISGAVRCMVWTERCSAVQSIGVHSLVGRERIACFARGHIKPILLHELLHAYHFNILSLRNPAILKAYDSARRADI